MESVETEEALKELFKNPEYELALLETGYRKPLPSLVVADKNFIMDTLKAHIILKVKPELDQFCEGLSTCSVLEYTQKYPSLMAERFTLSQVNLTQG